MDLTRRSVFPKATGAERENFLGINSGVDGMPTSGNQWVMLIDAVEMCDEPAVAHQLATAVGCPPRSGTTTEHV